MRLLTYGRRGLLVELASLEEALSLFADLEQRRPPGVIELIPGAQTVLIRFDPAHTNPTALGSELTERARTRESRVGAAGEAVEGIEVVEIEVVYDGPDLADVARLTGLTVAEVAHRHVGAQYRVAFTGFAPGFGYLSGGDRALAVPRRDTPRTRVQAGAVGLAGPFTGVYPRPGPGGWQIIGHTRTRTWDPERCPPALLRPGVSVSFRAARS